MWSRIWWMDKDKNKILLTFNIKKTKTNKLRGP
jgi:hypothetical protein